MELIEMRGLGLPKKRMKIKAIQGDTLVLVDDQNTGEMELDLKKINRSASWTVHRPREIEIRVGDKLLLQQNERSAGYSNGDLVTVSGFSPDAILLNNVRTINKEYTQFTHGWAVTSYASQGLTCDRVAISYDQGSYGGIDRRGFYVSASRGREDVRIYTDDKDFIRDCLRRNAGERTTATELVGFASRLVTTKMLRQRQKEIQEQAIRMDQTVTIKSQASERTMPAINPEPDRKVQVR